MSRWMRSWWVIGGLIGALALVAGACGDDDDDSDSATGGALGAPLPDDFSMEGTWTGHRERIASDEGYRNGDATLTVTAHEGLTFQGTLERTTPEGPESDPFVAAFTPGGQLAAGADEEGTYTFRFLDDDTLDFCYTESGDGYRTTCARLERDD